MHRFQIYPDSQKNGQVVLDKAESRHALTVLRVKPGEVVELLDGKGGVFQGIVAGIDRGAVKVSVSVLMPKKPNTVAITLAVSVIKPDAMELLVQKACELGAHAIIPIISERTVVRLSRERWESKNQRWQKIARESCKQCGQSTVPIVRPVEEFKKFIEAIADYDLALIPTLALPVEGLYQTLNSSKGAKSILLLIGPEGDFSQNEALGAVKHGAKPVSLGPLVLRSETAAMQALSNIEFFYREIAAGGK